jgi:hypothetical protein
MNALTIDSIIDALHARGQNDLASAVANFETVDDLAADVWTPEEEAQLAMACDLARGDQRERNRRMMFGENDEAFPSADEWSRIVD